MSNYPEVYETSDNLRNLLRAMHDKDAFNYICRGNLYNGMTIRYREVFKELCYAVERHCDRETLDNIVEEFEDNITEHIYFLEDMPWYDNRWREDNEEGEDDE